jgi:hypothetical protein
MIEVAVAFVAAGGAIVVALVNVRKQNSREHAENGTKLDGISYVLGKVEQKLDDHIDNHRRHP